MKKILGLNTIYILKNIINNKVYIGQSWWSLKDRWNNGHGYLGCKKLNNAIQKYGKNNFYYEIITLCGTQEASDYWEIFFIKKFNSINNGYNIAIGGKSVMRGRKHTKESLDKMSESHKGNTAHLGKMHSKETKDKLSELTKIQIKEKGHPSIGRHHSDESKTKISKSKSGIRNSISTEFKPKLTLEIAEKIREDKKNNIKLTDKTLGIKYNISATIVNFILNNKRWLK